MKVGVSFIILVALLCISKYMSWMFCLRSTFLSFLDLDLLLKRFDSR
jgi:hypothetical protein